MFLKLTGGFDGQKQNCKFYVQFIQQIYDLRKSHLLGYRLIQQ